MVGWLPLRTSITRGRLVGAAITRDTGALERDSCILIGADGSGVGTCLTGAAKGL